MMLALLALTVLGAISFGQCDKIVTLTSSKTQYLDSSFAVQKTVDENTVIQITKTEVTIAPGSEDDKMTGTIKSDICNWKKPFKEGKSIIKVPLKDHSGDVKNATITIEGKDGKVTLLLEVDEMPDKKIRVDIDQFEEKK
ncbi:MAG: hypothetical protein JWM28_2414 [Chitinophagaceae bacterium]|nr:hypothetical protein [Chitinophagaceae bacterium]